MGITFSNFDVWVPIAGFIGLICVVGWTYRFIQDIKNIRRMEEEHREMEREYREAQEN